MTGADPKSVLCAFYKQGLCTKGDKCKFSHDLTIGRKAEKKSIYDESDKKGDLMKLINTCIFTDFNIDSQEV